MSALEASARPFEASVTGNANLSPTDDPCIFLNVETGTGTATHLGAFGWRDEEIVDFCSLPGGVAVVATFVMTAANGDEIAGDLTTTGTFAPSGDLVIEGTYAITGGTGRFVGASGSGDVHVRATASADLPFAGTLKGDIVF